MTDKEVLLLRRKLDLLLRTGKLLMESAADTNRIERNMKRDSRGEIAYRYPMDHDYGERKRWAKLILQIPEMRETWY